MWPRACSVRAPHGAPSTWQHALDVRIELTRLQQVRTRAHQLLPPRPPPRTHTSCGRIEHIDVRHADLTRWPSLFAGMVVVASMSMALGLRAVLFMARCVRPTAHTPHTTPHLLTVARACCARLSELFIHHVQGAGDAAFKTEKLYVVRQHSSSTRSRCGSGERSRATSWTPPKACQGSCPAGAPTPVTPWASTHIAVACRVRVGFPGSLSG